MASFAVIVSDTLSSGRFLRTYVMKCNDYRPLLSQKTMQSFSVQSPPVELGIAQHGAITSAGFAHVQCAPVQIAPEMADFSHRREQERSEVFRASRDRHADSHTAAGLGPKSRALSKSLNP